MASKNCSKCSADITCNLCGGDGDNYRPVQDVAYFGPGFDSVPSLSKSDLYRREKCVSCWGRGVRYHDCVPPPNRSGWW